MNHGQSTRRDRRDFCRTIAAGAAGMVIGGRSRGAVPAAAVGIRIRSARPVAIHPGVYGINCAEMFIDDLAQVPEYVDALAELKLNAFLFPGGSGYHHPTGPGGFNMRAEEIAKSRHGEEHRANKPGSPDFFGQYVGMMKRMGGHAVYIPNLSTGTVEEMDYYLKTMADAGVAVDSVALGMEVQLGAYRFETAAAYIAVIRPYVDFLKRKYPAVRLAGWSTPVGRRASTPASYRQWNREVAKVEGLDGFSQYGWTEFGAAALRGRKGGALSTPEQRLHQYDEFVEGFQKNQIDVYAEDWGRDKRMFMLQWGTHADRNMAVQGLHTVNFLFHMTAYNAAHGNYFEAAAWSVPIMQDISGGKRKNRGGGPVYREKIALWAPYLYARPLRHFYTGDRELLEASVGGVEKSGAMEVVKAMAARGPEGTRHVCILNRGPAVALGAVTVDDQPLAPGTGVAVESAWAQSLDAAGGAVKTFTGEKPIGSITLEAYSVTTLTHRA